MVVNRKSSLRCRDAADERQYMLSGDYEVYEKVGEPVGAVSFHYHDFYELIYIIGGGIFFPDRGPGGADAEGRFPADR